MENYELFNKLKTSAAKIEDYFIDGLIYRLTNGILP